MVIYFLCWLQKYIVFLMHTFSASLGIPPMKSASNVEPYPLPTSVTNTQKAQVLIIFSLDIIIIIIPIVICNVCLINRVLIFLLTSFLL